MLSFLRDALEQRDPERDIPLASEIQTELQASLPEAEQERAAALDEVIRPVVDDLAARPEVWSAAVNLTAIYLDGDRRGARSDQLRLSSILMRALLLANAAGRYVFFQGIDEWNLLEALAPVLPELDLDPREAAALVRRVDAFTANDMARGMPMEAIKRWAATHAVTARRMVDAWSDGHAWAAGLDLSSVQVLVEGAVRTLSDGVAWRDDVIGRLLQANEERRWALAATLACFAWPEHEPPVEARHKALLTHVGRLPARLVDVGLRAVARDARAHPAASIATALRLLSMVPAGDQDPMRRQGRASDVAEIGFRALLGASEKEISLPTIRELLPHVLDVPLRAGGRTLDVLLAQMAKRDPGAAEALAAQWLGRHAASLREDPADLQAVLPAFAHRLGPEGAGAWLVRTLVGPRPEVRLAAASLIARKHGYIVREDAFLALSPLQAEAFAHELVGIGVPGNIYVPLLVRLAEARADAREAVRAILMEEAVEDYPGVCREVLARWNDGGESRDPALTSLREELTACLRRRSERYGWQKESSELWMTSPARGPWLVLQNRIFQESIRAERSSGRHPLQALALRIPIARGEGTRMPGQNPEIVPLQTHSGSVEFPFRDSIDRVAPVQARIRHRERAAALLAAEEVSA
ncbi:uncharacterized protein SOCEGT47_029240 [Sorangium cellulosum]|uniref:Uncharacterized protein n=1 Tax=Sorangium cellulosum TaxID=56 RepID=A0A4P2Q073_SORCE|nr:hypothetical protein [Sorangium cellulosum]AUX22421.1 uncharacterized protein SOCEGT47_029240 [Sorangium cellulosum]